MKFPAQTQDPHAERHIRQLLYSYRPGQHDQEAVTIIATGTLMRSPIW